MGKKLFKAQALAIVMLILVIASIIGVSLFSRMSKDKDISVNEQDSAIALAQVDAVLDLFVGADLKEIERVLGTTDINTDKYGSFKDFLTYLEGEGIISDTVRAEKIESTEWCINADSSSLKCTISYAEDDKYVEVQSGSVLAFNLDDLSCSDCILRVNLKPVEEYSAFLVKRIMDDGTEVTETKENYCITKAGGFCGADIDNTKLGDIDGNTWETDPSKITNDDTDLYHMNFDLQAETGNSVVEIRILPISGILAFNNVQPENVTDRNFIPIKVSAEATCNVTRGEEMYLPGSGLLGYSTLFDYGIYDNGFFQP